MPRGCASSRSAIASRNPCTAASARSSDSPIVPRFDSGPVSTDATASPTAPRRLRAARPVEVRPPALERGEQRTDARDVVGHAGSLTTATAARRAGLACTHGRGGRRGIRNDDGARCARAAATAPVLVQRAARRVLLRLRRPRRDLARLPAVHRVVRVRLVGHPRVRPLLGAARLPRAAAPAPHPDHHLRARLLHRPRAHERRAPRRSREPRRARRRAAAARGDGRGRVDARRRDHARARAGASSRRPSPVAATTRHP